MSTSHLSDGELRSLADLTRIVTDYRDILSLEPYTGEGSYAANRHGNGSPVSSPATASQYPRACNSYRNYFADAKPPGKLVVARSYDKDGTKTKVSRLVPVHPALAHLLEEWKRSGWGAVYGQAPTPRITSSRDRSTMHPQVDEDDAPDIWQADQANKLFLADLDALGMRRRRGHDLRRTFITLAQEDGARRDVLQVITHAPNPADVMSQYTTFPWPTLCAEVAKLQISLPEPCAARPVTDRAEPAPDAARHVRPGLLGL